MNVERNKLSWGLVGGAIALATALTAACVDHVDTSIKPCPCESGLVCCESGVCAADATNCGAATAALSASVQGSWSGYIENFQPDAPDAVRITIAVAPDGTVSGQATFGNGAAPPPPPDPALPWPPNYDTHRDPTFIAGATYHASDINWQSRRLKLKLLLSEPWQPWCALLPSYPTGNEPPSYGCAQPGIGSDGNGACLLPGATAPTSCDKWQICGLLCQCDASGCRANTSIEGFTIPLDIAFDGAKADGSLRVVGSTYNLRLMREP